MNGRVYDYNVGRFLSVDPFIHGGSQGLNPYSYIMNNPLSGTDPSGYAPDKEEKKVKVFVLGSRIKRTVTVSASQTGNTVSINLTGGNGADQKAVANLIVGAAQSKGFNDVDSPANIAQDTSSSVSNTGNNVGETPSGGDSLQDQIKSDAHNAIMRTGQAGSAEAENSAGWVKTGETEDGIPRYSFIGEKLSQTKSKVSNFISMIRGESFKQCVAQCINNYYGDSYAIASSLSPLSLQGWLTHEATTHLEDKLSQKGNRNAWGSSKGEFDKGRRQLKTLSQFKKFNGASLILGAGAAGYQLGALGYCSAECIE
jgi:hypothetical protein